MPGEEQGQQQSGLARLREEGRVDARMRRDDLAYHPEQIEKVRGDLIEYQRASAGPNGRPLSWAAIAERVGGGRKGQPGASISGGTLHQFANSVYTGDNAAVARRVDEFLATEEKRGKRLDTSGFVRTEVAKLGAATVQAIIAQNSIGALIAPSGCGKTKLALALAAEHTGGVYMRVDEGHGDGQGISRLLCLTLGISPPHGLGDKLNEIVAYLQRRRGTVLFVDEAQKIGPGRRGPDGLETLRDIHDRSDPTGQRCVPIMLFGDEHFHRLIVESRSGERRSLRPQMTRRLFPVVDVQRDLCGDDGGGELFTIDDVRRVLRMGKVRLFTDGASRWLKALANLPSFGALGFAVAVARMAFSLKKPNAQGARIVDTPDLLSAMELMIGPDAVEEADREAGGELRRARSA